MAKLQRQVGILEKACRKALESAKKIPPNYHKDSVVTRLSEALKKVAELERIYARKQ